MKISVHLSETDLSNNFPIYTLSEKYWIRYNNLKMYILKFYCSDY